MSKIELAILDAIPVGADYAEVLLALNRVSDKFILFMEEYAQAQTSDDDTYGIEVEEDNANAPM